MSSFLYSQNSPSRVSSLFRVDDETGQPGATITITPRAVFAASLHITAVDEGSAAFFESLAREAAQVADLIRVHEASKLVKP